MKKFWLTTSWDDGAREDLKLAKLLEKYQIPATFYLPLKNPERKVLTPEEIQSLARSFEIGSHTLSHQDLTKLSSSQLKKEIREDKERLEAIVGRPIVSFAYPKGKVNKKAVAAVKRANFLVARTTKLFSFDFDNFYLLPTTAHAYNHHPLLYLKEGFFSRSFYHLGLGGFLKLDWEEIALKLLDYALTQGGIFHLWGHSWEIEKFGNWKKLERVLAEIKKLTKKDQRVTNSELRYRALTEKKKAYLSMDPQVYHASFDNDYFQKEETILRQLVEKFDQPGKRVLEIGCGAGRLSRLFQKASYVGIDFNPKFIKFARNVYPEKNKKFSINELSKLNFKNLGIFDLILAWGLFEDEDNPLSIVSAFQSGLKGKGAGIIFNLINRGNPFNLLGYKLLGKTKFLYRKTLHNWQELRKDLAIFCQENGFQYRLLGQGVLVPSKKLGRFAQVGFLVNRLDIGPRLAADLVVVLNKK